MKKKEHELLNALKMSGIIVFGVCAFIYCAKMWIEFGNYEGIPEYFRTGIAITALWILCGLLIFLINKKEGNGTKWI